MDFRRHGFASTLVALLGIALIPAASEAKTSGTHQNTVRKEVTYSVEGDIHEARISFIDSSGRVEHDIVRVPWKVKVSVPCKRKVSIAARNMSPSGNVIARIAVEGETVKEVTGEGHLAGVFAEALTCP